MASRPLKLDELKGRRVEELLQDVADKQATVIVLLPDGNEVAIEPKHRLNPLPELEGYVPRGWKDSIYGQ